MGAFYARPAKSQVMDLITKGIGANLTATRGPVAGSRDRAPRPNAAHPVGRAGPLTAGGHRHGQSLTATATDSAASSVPLRATSPTGRPAGTHPRVNAFVA